MEKDNKNLIYRILKSINKDIEIKKGKITYFVKKKSYDKIIDILQRIKSLELNRFYILEKIKQLSKN